MYKMMYPDFGAKEWIEYYDCLNSEVPVDRLRLKLNDEQKEEYAKSLAFLKEQRKTFPGFGYEIKYSWFE